MSLSSGALVDHYRIVSLLGRGGMGEVYHAVDANLARPVALKVLSQQLIRSDAAVLRFVQEARAASALNHPNIVTVYDIGKAEAPDTGTPIHYIAMELIEGETLRALVRRDALSLQERVDVLAQIAAGLAKAHAAGIIHRDLKPDNVMVTSDGYAKVLDFGLAKLIEKERVEHGTTSRQLTQIGAVMGTIGYMSPEQIEQQHTVDHRSDIFSFGCVAYHALTGKSAFDRGSLVDTLHAIVHDAPEPIAGLVPDCPAVLVELVDQCLAKKPEKRPASMRDVAQQLQDIARATDPSSRVRLPPARGRLGPAAIGAILLVLLVATALTGMLGRRSPAGTPFDQMRITRMASNGRATITVVSPDGKYVAYSVDEGGRQSLWIRQVASGSDIPIVPLADSHFVGASFSPDSNYVYYSSADNKTDRGAVYQVPVIGGAPKMIANDLHVRLTVSPDGQRFAYAQTDRARSRSLLATRRIDGSDEKIVSVRTLPETYTAVSWSPEGDALAYAYVTYGGGYHAVLGEIAIGDRKEKTIAGTPPWRIVDSVVSLPNGEGLVVNAKDGSDSRNQLWLLDRNGKSRRITNDLADYEGVSVTTDGSKLLTLQRTQSSSLWVAPGGDAARARQLARGGDNLDGMAGLACLPDGRVVYASSSNDARDLWITGTDGGNRRRLTDGGSDTLPSTSLDGKSVVFMSMRNARSNIWRVDVATGALMRLTSGDFESSPALAPDGGWVAFHSNRSGVRTIWRVNIKGGEPEQVTTNSSSWPSISPDGQWIASSWFNPANARIGIAVFASATGQLSKFFEIPVNAWMGGNNHHVRWYQGGLAYVSNQKGVSNIWLQPMDGTAPRQLTQFDDGQIFYFDWTQDSRDLVLSRGSVSSNVVMIESFR